MSLGMGVSGKGVSIDIVVESTDLTLEEVEIINKKLFE